MFSWSPRIIHPENKSSTHTIFVCWKSLQAQSPVLNRQEWKRGNHNYLGQVRAYEPKPPAGTTKDVDPNQYPLKLIKLEYDPNPSVRGWQKFRISIPPAVRARYIDDQVFGEDWANILKDFDHKTFDWLHVPFWCLFNFDQFVIINLVSWEMCLQDWVLIASSLHLICFIFLHGAGVLYFPKVVASQVL